MIPMTFIESVGLTGVEACCGCEGMGEERILVKHGVPFCEIKTFWRLFRDVKILNMIELHTETW